MKIRSKDRIVRERLNALTTLFFKMIHETDDESIDRAVPWLARLLQEYDSTLGEYPPPLIKGVPAATAFSAAIDVRTIYVLFKGLQTKSVKERRRVKRELEREGFPSDQFEAIKEALLIVKGKPASQVRPIAAFPLYRLQPDYQSKDALERAKALLG